MAGVMIASQKRISPFIIHTLEPIKQIFGALFFSSIGLHIYPSFLYNEGILLLTLTLFVMVFKVVVSALVVNIAFRVRVKNAIVIGVGLAQISEFTFVLASKAKGLVFRLEIRFSLCSRGILSREFFFILIGITSISMFLSPFLWYLVTSFYIQKQPEQDEFLFVSSVAEVEMFLEGGQLGAGQEADFQGMFEGSATSSRSEKMD